MVKNLNQCFNNAFNKPDVAALILRVSLGGLLFFHGWHKVVAGIDPIINMLGQYGIPAIVGYGVYIGEVIAPVLLVLGILCRLSSLAILGTMFVAWLLVGVNKTFQLNAVGAWAIEDLLLYAAMAVVVLFLGCGKYSVMRDPAWR